MSKVLQLLLIVATKTTNTQSSSYIQILLCIVITAVIFWDAFKAIIIDKSY